MSVLVVAVLSAGAWGQTSSASSMLNTGHASVVPITATQPAEGDPVIDEIKHAVQKSAIDIAIEALFASVRTSLGLTAGSTDPLSQILTTIQTTVQNSIDLAFSQVR